MHPESLSVTSGVVVEFRVKATGDRLQFQWQKDCKDVCDGSKYCGTNTNTLRINETEKSDKGCYRCLVENYVRGKFSEEAALTVSKFINILMCLVFYLPVYHFGEMNLV